jgi:hypothetical protein
MPTFCREDGALTADWQEHQEWYDVETIPSGTPWRIPPESIAPADSACAVVDENGLSGAAVCDDHAFVRDGYLVASFEDAVFWLNGREIPTKGFRTRLRRGHAVAKLEQDAQKRWFVEGGIVTGVTTVEDVLQSFVQVGLCEQKPALATVEGTLRAILDVPLDPNAPGDACDGLSIAWELDALETGGGCVCHLPPDSSPSSSDAGAAGGGSSDDGGSGGGVVCPIEETARCECDPE